MISPYPPSNRGNCSCSKECKCWQIKTVAERIVTLSVIHAINITSLWYRGSDVEHLSQLEKLYIIYVYINFISLRDLIQ